MSNETVELHEALTAFKAKTVELETFLKTAQPEMQENGKSIKDVVATAEKLAKQVESFGARVTEIEQKQVEKVKQGDTLSDSIGQLFVKSQSMRDFIDGAQGANRAKLVLTDRDFIKNTIVNTDSTTPPDRQSYIIPGAFRRLRLRDVVPIGQTGLNSIETTREASYTNLAAETAEGGSKPESAITFDLVTTPIRTIATFLKLSKQIIADAPTVASYVDLRLAHLVDKRVDSQIVNGGGTGADLSGMTKSGNYTAFTPLSGNNQYDNIAIIAGLLGASEYDISAVLLNPIDGWAMQRAKGTTNDHYFSDPYSMAPLAAWGVPIILSNAVTQGKIIAADFTQAYFYWNRQGTVVEMFEQDDVNVQKNLVTLRAETRGGFETRIPAASYYGNLTA